MANDYYATLGVDRDATQAEIKKAFYGKARTMHPDVSKDADAEEKFKDLNEAYEVLSDESKRAQYDRYGTVGNMGGFSNSYVDLDDLFGGGGFGDIFSSFFGGGGGRGSAAVRNEGRDMQVGIRITLEEIATGVDKEIVYDRLVKCPTCEGTGVAAGGSIDICPNCQGRGSVTHVQQTFMGTMQTQAPCNECHGSGKIVNNPCRDCDGEGRTPDRERITINVPKGIRDGQQLRVSGYGETGRNGARSGDLLVTIHVNESEYFQRDGDNLHARATVSIAQAALGAKVQIVGIMPDEIVDVTVPAGCQHGHVVRVKGKGLSRFKSDARGDLFVHVDVAVPNKLTKRQKELLRELDSELGDGLSRKRTPLQHLSEVMG